MKTHELASELQRLAKILRSAPNVDFGDITLLAHRQPQLSPGDVAVGLSTLVQLSRIDKQQWVSMIEEYGFPISVRPADASRDVLGKLLRFLDRNPQAMRQLRDKTKHASSSPQLMRALDALLKDS